MKLCRGCGLEKDSDQFPINKSSPDGLHSRCRTCRAEAAKVRRNRPEVKAADSERLRTHYLENRVKLLEQRRVRYEQNKDRELARNKRWSDANRERHRAINRDWSKKNPVAARAIVARRRARIAGADGFYTKNDVIAMLAEQGGACRACGCDLVVSGFHVDHVMPISKGGSNDRANLQILCPTCNRSKGAKLPDAWNREIHR